MQFAPNSYGVELREMNSCHSPQDGKFCSGGAQSIKLTDGQLAALDGRGLSKHDRVHYEEDLTDEEKLVVSVWRDGKLHVTPENAASLASALTRLANDEDELAEDKTLPKQSRVWARAARTAFSNLADKVWRMAKQP